MAGKTKSQSLLYQGFVSTYIADAIGAIIGSLNPFFIRASFQPLGAVHYEIPYPPSQSLLYQGFVSTAVRPAGRDHRRRVSIPSLSGLRFNGRSAVTGSPSGGLNPFFIRASFQRI